MASKEKLIELLINKIEADLALFNAMNPGLELTIENVIEHIQEQKR